MAKLDRIYDLRRNCLLNELYYGHRLSLFNRIDFWLDVVIVIGSTASGVSGWFIWTTYPELKAIWAVIATAATLLTALKPVLHIDGRVKRYSALFASYRQLSISMAYIIEDITEAGCVSLELEHEVDRVRRQCRDLAADDDPKPSTKLVRQLQSEVNRRVPVDSLFYPPGRDTANAQKVGHGTAGETEVWGVGVGPTEPWPINGRDHARG